MDEWRIRIKDRDGDRLVDTFESRDKADAFLTHLFESDLNHKRAWVAVDAPHRGYVRISSIDRFVIYRSA